MAAPETGKLIRTVLIGMGTVNRGWLSILQDRREALAALGYQFLIVGVADSSGVAVKQEGFSIENLISLKPAGKKVRDLEGFLPDTATPELLTRMSADLVIESSPANLVDGEPGLSVVRSALSRGTAVVLANKTPLIFAFDELQSSSKKQGVGLAYSATVCGGLPVVNVLRRDLKLATVKRIRGIFNATSNFVLDELERGRSQAEAIREAQRLGAAEADPSHDLKGHDTANKLFIIMKSFTDFKGSINDIRTEGIQQITVDDLAAVRAQGEIIKLVAEAAFEAAEAAALVARGGEGWEMGFEIESDLYEKICMKNYEADPLGTAAAVMRDCLMVMGG